ncbi:LysR family transcriptional regulator substrate-binding protein, partial [Candidatus Poribacteria bacterium]|nr:LysR family transcriptional regulator substrate-binding protein [Candidatus Poribacteria bacterium]
SGEINIAAGESTILYLLPDVIKRFAEAYPSVRLKLHNVTGRDGMAMLRADQAELDGEREQRVFDHDLKRNAVSKAEAGTADEPGIARKIYRTDATLYSEGYGARADNHVTGNTTGHDRKPDKPAKDNTNAITEQSAAEVFLCEKADAYAEEHDGVNFTAALAKSVEALGTEGMRLRNLMYGKGA